MRRKVVRGGTVVTEAAAFAADVLIVDDAIAAIGRDLGDGDDEVVDASGCFVLPGLVDSHVHLSLEVAGTVSADDFATGTAAAAAGGTTCVIDFAPSDERGLLAALRDRRAHADAEVHVDYGLHVVVARVTDRTLREMADVVAAGAPSFKVFMAYPDLMLGDADLLRVLRRARQVGGLVCVHAEAGELIGELVREALAAGDTEPRFHAQTRPPLTEAQAVARVVALAQMADAELFVMHVTCAAALQAVRGAQDAGAPVAAETCVQYLALDERELARPGFEGAKYVCSPPLRRREDQEALWSALRQAALEVCSSDHCPFDYRGQKDRGRGDFSQIPNGLPTIEHRLALLWELGVQSGRITPSDLVRVCATAPARRFGLLPRKGAILPGADADLVVLDPRRTTTIAAATHRMNVDYNPFEGMTCRGSPRVVLSRGEVICREGTVLSRPGRGRYVPRSPVAR